LGHIVVGTKGDSSVPLDYEAHTYFVVTEGEKVGIKYSLDSFSEFKLQWVILGYLFSPKHRPVFEFECHVLKGHFFAIDAYGVKTGEFGLYEAVLQFELNAAFGIFQ